MRFISVFWKKLFGAYVKCGTKTSTELQHMSYSFINTYLVLLVNLVTFDNERLSPCTCCWRPL